MPTVSEVETKTLVSFNLKKATLLKIDVEGAEMRVLSGALNTLARLKPAIWIELHRDEDLMNGGFPCSRRDVLELLETLDYRKVHGKDHDTNFFFVQRS